MATRPQSDHPPLEGSQLLLGTLALSLASFMTILDSSVASVSLSAISGDLAVSPTQGTWVVTSFGVANALAVPLVGWLSQRFGQVRLMVILVLLFVTASWLCGMAPNIETLIIMRVIQGLVTGPIIPLAQTLLLSSYPPSKSGVALAASSTTVMMAPVIGPVMGGWIIDNLTWRWIFFINLPIGLVVALIVWVVYRPREVQPKRVRVDYIGLILLALWVGALQMMINLGRDYDWFDSWEIIGLAAAAIVFLVLFLGWELTDEHPIVDLRLFGNWNYALGTFVLSCGFGLFLGNSVLMPLWLQSHMGYTAVLAGLTVAPVGILSILFTPWVGRNVMRFDPRVFITIGLASYCAAFLIRSTFTIQTPISAIMFASFVQGGATSFFFIPLQTMMYSGLNAGRTPGAVGLANFFRLLTGALSASFCITLWESRATLHRVHMVEHLPLELQSFAQAQGALQGLGFGAEQRNALISRMIDQQAFTQAATEINFVSGLFYIALALVAWQMSVKALREQNQQFRSSAAAAGGKPKPATTPS